MRLQIITFLLLFTLASLNAQYQFTTDKELACTAVKNQQNTGTCWSFSTLSFLESELMRMGKPGLDLSEMHIVRNIYKDKARNYLLRQGKANFSQGSLSHDVIRAFTRHGIVPESVYSGKLPGEETHNHSEMEKALKGMLDALVGSKRLSDKWMAAVDGILDAYLGEVPEKFEYKGKSYTAETFGESLGLNLEDYVSITSFSHHPFYKSFVLEIPDNYSNGSYFNVPLDELQAIVDNALRQGYSIAWDGDVSEKGFSARNGLAIVPTDAKRSDIFDMPGPEMEVNQQNRQELFENYSTTDDHLMHLVGLAKDPAGTTYYITKNSWGEIGQYEGYLYMSSAYFRLKTVAVMVHKDAIPKDIAAKLEL